MPKPLRKSSSRKPKRSAPSEALDSSPIPNPRTVLVACTGLSPAVLTETVWALAQENPPVIPDRIVVITTLTGQKKLTEHLFGPDEIWRQLRTALLGQKTDTDPRLDFDTTPDRVKVVHRRTGTRRVPLDELATAGDHTAFADAVTQELWAHTSQPDTRVIASLAGGFKTMSALMLSAMQLLANPGDRVTHVLLGGGFEATEPPFYFPTQSHQKLTGKFTKQALLAADAAKFIQHIDVPVIPLRRWFAEALNRKPPSYETLVNSSIQALNSHLDDIRLELSPVALPSARDKHWMKLNGAEHPLSPDRYVYLRFFAEQISSGAALFPSPHEALEKLQPWITSAAKKEPRLARAAEGIGAKKYTADDLPKRLKDLRTFLEKLPSGRSLAAALPSKGHWGLRLKPEFLKLS